MLERVQEAQERSSLLGDGPGGVVGVVGVHAAHPGEAQLVGFLKNCMGHFAL